MSIVQGGPGFPVLHANVYNYIVTGKYIGVHTPDEDVANPTVVALLQEVSLKVTSIILPPTPCKCTCTRYMGSV